MIWKHPQKFTFIYIDKSAPGKGMNSFFLYLAIGQTGFFWLG